MPSSSSSPSTDPTIPGSVSPSACGMLSQGSWEEAHRTYKENIVQMVSPRWAVLSWVYHLLRISPPRPELCDFRISIAEMQRMHMTALQRELVDLGIQLRWPNDLPKTFNRLPAVLKEYSMALFFLSSLLELSIFRFNRSQSPSHLGRTLTQAHQVSQPRQSAIMTT
jgi:hypothetical protein